MRHYFTREAHISDAELSASIKQWSYPLQDTADLEPLMKRIGDSRIVMLGEASHGTHEFYTWRARITKKLIEEKGFNFIAVEGDWPDCYKLNRYIKNYPGAGNSAFEVLQGFNRWPTWMWANWEIVALAEWLFKHNQSVQKSKKAGFYGLDVYSLWESMESILQYLEQTDPAALEVAKEAFQCFEPYRHDEGRSYARAQQFVPELCQNEVVHLLKEIRQKMPSYNSDAENVFNTEQNALVAVHAEQYYRSMLEGGPHSWNIRDQHMADTLERILKFHGEHSKAIVWAHNTHVGDARATDMVDEGLFNIGELARIRYGDPGVVLVGFGTYEGTVIAGRSWGAPMQNMQVPGAINESWEYHLHRAGASNKILIMEDFMDGQLMEVHLGHRAIGVVYNSKYEQYSNYVPTILPMRYDAFIYLDQTQALHPLYIEANKDQAPETFPFGV